MTSITKYKAQWEREAVEAEQKKIAEWLKASAEKFLIIDDKSISLDGRYNGYVDAANAIERGEYKSEAKG